MFDYGNLALLSLFCLGALALAPFYRAAAYFIKRVTGPVRAEMKAAKKRGCHADHS